MMWGYSFGYFKDPTKPSEILQGSEPKWQGNSGNSEGRRKGMNAKSFKANRRKEKARRKARKR